MRSRGRDPSRCTGIRRPALTCVPHLGRAPATGRATAIAGRRCPSARQQAGVGSGAGEDTTGALVRLISGWPTLRVTASTTKPGSGRACGTSSVRGAARCGARHEARLGIGLGVELGTTTRIHSDFTSATSETWAPEPRSLAQRPGPAPGLNRSYHRDRLMPYPWIDRPHAIGEKPGGCNDCEEGSRALAFVTLGASFPGSSTVRRCRLAASTVEASSLRRDPGRRGRLKPLAARDCQRGRRPPC